MIERVEELLLQPPRDGPSLLIKKMVARTLPLNIQHDTAAALGKIDLELFASQYSEKARP